MSTEFGPVIKRAFGLKKNEGQNKVISLEEAIKQNVKPGMTIYLDEGANAAARAILKQFWGSRPQFTLVMPAVSGDPVELVSSGLVKKIITSACIERRPSLGPISVIQRAYQDKSVEIENWSLLTLMLRLMAGALGVSFMPTKSLLDSSVAKANRDSFIALDDPFGSGQRVGLVKALNPDLAIVHALAADRYGNCILPAGSMSGYSGWGPKASRGGVVVTAEKITTTDYIRRHAALTTLPGHVVRSVSQASFGAHPEGMLNRGISGFASYGEDPEYMDEVRKARRDPKLLNAWVKEWVLDCPSHEEYLKKLGTVRLSGLKSRAEKDTWQNNLERVLKNISTSPEYSATEMMIITAARKTREKTLQRGYRTLLVGAGTALLAAWLAYLQLTEEGYDVELVNGPGLFGYMPRPADPSITNYHSLATCKMLGDVMQSYGWMVSGTDKCLAILGAAEIDKLGNINSAIANGGLYLTGPGGANDAGNAAEVMVVITQSAQRLVKKVSYVTVPRSRVTTLVSDWGIFHKLSPNQEFILTGCLPRSEAKDGIISCIKERCGWEVRVSDKLEEIKPPTIEELTILRLLDGGVFLGPR